MTEAAKIPPHVVHMLDCPVIYFDQVPTLGLHAGVISLTLGVHVGEPKTASETTDHIVAVANLRLPMAAVAHLRSALETVALLGAPTPGASN
jgi:hypothetical protein